MDGRISLILCLSAALIVIGISAPILHDEAVVLLEFTGLRNWPHEVSAASAVKTSALHGHPGMRELLVNVGSLGYQITPSLYYPVLWCWRQMAGDSLIAARILSALLWAGALGVFWLWSRSRLALTLLVLGPMGIRFAALARGYALAALLVIAAAYFADAKRARSRWNVPLAGLFSALAIWTHYLTLAPVAIILTSRMIPLWYTQKRRVLLAAGIAMAVLLPAGYFAFLQIRPTPVLFPGWGQEAYRMLRMLLRLPIGPGLEAGHWMDLLHSAIFLTALLLTGAGLRQRSCQVQLCFFVVLGQAVWLTLLAGVTGNDLSSGRYLGLVLPFCYLLLVDCCNRFGRASHRWKPALVALVALCAGVDGFRLVELNRTRRETLSAARSTLFIAGSLPDDGVPATILHGIPGAADFVVFPPDGDLGDFVPALKTYGSVWICPADEPPWRNETAVLDRKSAIPIRLFREYSCYRLNPPGRTSSPPDPAPAPLAAPQNPRAAPKQ